MEKDVVRKKKRSKKKELTKEEKKLKMLEMRIKGETFERIAKKLKVSKRTLINWSKDPEIKESINSGLLMKHQAILKEFETNRIGRVKYLSKLINKLSLELDNRDLSNVSTDKILKMILLASKELDGLTPSLTFGGELIKGIDWGYEEYNAPDFYFNTMD